MQTRYSVDQATGRRRPRRALIAGARRHLVRALTVAVVFAPLLALFGTAGPAAAATTGYYTNPASPDNPTCPSGTYTVPSGTRYVQITAAGGAGAAGSTRVLFDGLNPGLGGTGAQVMGIFPVTAGQTLYVVVGRNGAFNREDVATTYSGWPDGGQNPTNNGGGGGSSFVTTQPLFARSGCKDGTKDTIVDPPTVMNLDRSRMMIVAGGGGGGGNAGSVRSGGNGGNAGARADFGGEAGSDGNHGDIDCNYGRGGGGASKTAVGAGGAACTGSGGEAGHGFYGGGSPLYGIGPFTMRVGASGAGGGGWYGGGSGSEANAFQGGGGGGAGASYVTPTNYPISISKDTSGTPSVTITPLANPTTTATLSGTTSGNNWFTSALTVTLTAQAGTFSLGKTYFALDDPTCSAANVHLLERCTEYKAPFTISGGVHTLTYFSIDAMRLDEAVQAKTFAVTPTNSAGVTAASLGSGTNPTATAGGAAGAPGSVSVSSTGTGVVGAAVYGANPAGATVFNSSGAFVDVIVAGSGLTSLTITDCHLNGGTSVYWWDGTGWALVSDQTYDAKTGCVTITVKDSGTMPTVSQLTGTVIAAGSPPTTTAVATTADGKPYTAGTWTNQSVTVAFTCSANATPTAPVTRASDEQNQSASGTCTDGLGQKTTTTFTGINVDKTPPACSIRVSPTVLWPPNSKPVAITGTVTVGDNLSGIARVVGGTITSNEALGSGDVQGFTVNTTYTSPLKLSAILDLNGTLIAKRAGGGSGRSYSQLVTVTDQAGNTASCTWTVTVPHDQR